MRLDKYLAHAGVGTRKEVKQLIRKKHVRVNDTIVCKDDMHINDTDAVFVDDEEVYYEQFVYLMLNKPEGVISATEDDEYETVLDCFQNVTLPKGCFPVGRLDIDTEGLVLITNDGKLAHKLLSPKHHVEKTYYVEHKKVLTDENIEMLCNGSVVLDDKIVLPARLDRIDAYSSFYHIKEGRYHQVKRMFHAVNNEVTYLKRISMGSLILDEELAIGEWRPLYEDEIEKLKAI